jgi:hypothetical protein
LLTDDDVFVSTINLPADILGELDARPGTWGRAGVRIVPYHFKNVPNGKRVRIIKVEGDLVSWPHGIPVTGTFAGVLWGLTRSSVTEQGDSPELDYASDGCFIYIQDRVGAEGSRAAFERDTYSGGLLDEDHIMVNKIAVWLNETEASIHSEATAVLTYCYEDA